jgi:hypothetical protein
MLATFFTLLVFVLVLPKEAKLSRKIWVVIIVLALMLSFLLAYVSVTSVWRPHRMQHDYFDVQNSADEYEGVFPWAKLSYPFYLNLFHGVPFNPLSQNDNGFVYGQARFSIFIANVRIIAISSTCWYAEVRGWTPLYYRVDFIFSNPDAFYDFLIALFTTLNVIGALLGFTVAKTLGARLGK